MQVIIVGCGKVGFTIAQQLSIENHDVVVIDNDEESLRKASETLDVQCLHGNGANLAILKSAMIGKCDLVIATTNSDEVNMVICLAAKKLGALYTIARIRDMDYSRDISLLQEELDIDLVINPEQATALEISRLLRFPDAIDMDTFYHGRIELVGFRVMDDDFLTGTPLSQLMSRFNLPILFCAVQRGDETIIPNGSTVLLGGDKVYIIGNTSGINKFFKTLGRILPKITNIFIMGGSRIAEYLSRRLERSDIDVKLIESDPERCRVLCERLPKALIINGDGTDSELLASENISKAGAFIALTGRDEDNLITSLYAKQTGVPKVIVKVDRPNLSGVLRSLDIESIVTPHQITAESILHFIRGMHEGNQIQSLYRIADGKFEAVELISPVSLGVPLKKLKLKPGILIALIVRNRKFIIPGGNDTIEKGDNVIIIADKIVISGINDILLED